MSIRYLLTDTKMNTDDISVHSKTPDVETVNSWNSRQVLKILFDLLFLNVLWRSCIVSMSQFEQGGWRCLQTVNSQWSLRCKLVQIFIQCCFSVKHKVLVNWNIWIPLTWMKNQVFELVYSCKPSIRTPRASLRILIVVMRTSIAKTKVQIGSASFHSGWERKDN